MDRYASSYFACECYAVYYGLFDVFKGKKENKVKHALLERNIGDII